MSVIAHARTDHRGIKDMPSRHENVILPGRLGGMGRNEECSVHAVEVSLPGTENHIYTHPVISGAPSDLPDGLYSLRFGGATARAERLHGAWILPVAVRVGQGR
jgi:hypothetical protein